MWASFNRFELRITLEDARIGSHQGECDGDILRLAKVGYIKRQLDKLDPRAVREELSEYGAWDDSELADHADNLDRILWIACGNITEDMTP